MFSKNFVPHRVDFSGYISENVVNSRLILLKQSDINFKLHILSGQRFADPILAGEVGSGSSRIHISKFLISRKLSKNVRIF